MLLVGLTWEESVFTVGVLKRVLVLGLTWPAASGGLPNYVQDAEPTYPVSAIWT